VTFEQIFDGMSDRMEAIVTFLGLLEMLNQHKVKIVVGLQKNSFWITQNAASQEEE